jgi:hypothetical protein
MAVSDLPPAELDVLDVAFLQAADAEREDVEVSRRPTVR